MALKLPEQPKRQVHNWTEAEHQLVREWYGKVPTPELARKIGVSENSLRWMAATRLKVYSQGHRGHYWTEEEDVILRREYEQTTESSRYLAAKLGLKEHQVRRRAAYLGIGKITDRRQYWTQAEEETLATMLEKGHTVQTIAKRLGRGYNSVVVRAKVLKLSRKDRNGWYTKRDVYEILGVDHRWVQARIDSGALKARPHFAGDTPQKDGRHPWHIKEKDLKAFIVGHPHELTGRNVDLVAIVDLLTGGAL